MATARCLRRRVLLYLFSLFQIQRFPFISFWISWCFYIPILFGCWKTECQKKCLVFKYSLILKKLGHQTGGMGTAEARLPSLWQRVWPWIHGGWPHHPLARRGQNGDRELPDAMQGVQQEERKQIDMIEKGMKILFSFFVLWFGTTMNYLCHKYERKHKFLPYFFWLFFFSIV